MLEDDGAHPFTSVYFGRLSQWSKLPWVVGRLTAPGMVDDYMLMALFARLNLCYVLPPLDSSNVLDAEVDGAASVVLCSECCGRTARWKGEWSQLVVAGQLVKLSHVLADCLHYGASLCPWHGQASRVLAGENSLLVPTRCAAVPLEPPGTWRLPLGMAPSSVVRGASALRDAWRCAGDDNDASQAPTACTTVTMYGLVCSSLRRNLWAVTSSRASSVGASGDGGVTFVPAAELPPLYQDMLGGGAVRLGATEIALRCLECLYCGCVTASVRTKGNQEKEEAPLEAGNNATNEATSDDGASKKEGLQCKYRIAVGVSESHHPWCAWRQMFLARVLATKERGDAKAQHHYPLGPAHELVSLDPQGTVETLANVLAATMHDEEVLGGVVLPPRVLRHPCWSVAHSVDARRTVVAYRAEQHPLLYQKPSAPTGPDRHPDGTHTTPVTVPSPTEAVLRTILRPTTAAAAKGLALTGPWVSMYTDLRNALFVAEGASTATRKRPRSVEGGNDDDGVADADAPGPTKDGGALSVLAACHALAVRNATAQPPDAAPSTAETMAWDALRIALGEESSSTIANEPTSLASVETYVASVQQAVADAQIPRRVVPPPTAAPAPPRHNPAAAAQHASGAGSPRAVAGHTPHHHHHNRSVGATPPVGLAGQPQHHGGSPPQQPFRPHHAQHHHHQHAQHHTYMHHHHQHQPQHGFVPAFQGGNNRGQPPPIWNAGNAPHHNASGGGSGLWDAPPAGAALFATPPPSQPPTSGGVLGPGGYGGAPLPVLGHHQPYSGGGINRGPFGAPSPQPSAAAAPILGDGNRTVKQPPAPGMGVHKQPAAPSKAVTVSGGGPSKQPPAPTGSVGGGKQPPAPGSSNKQPHAAAGNMPPKQPQQQQQQSSGGARGRGGRGGRGGAPNNQQQQESHRGGRGGNKRR